MIELRLKEALIDLQNAIGAADAAVIKARMSFLDDALEAHREDLDPQLNHFLKNRSYLKALAFLSHETDIPKGRCGGRVDFS